MEIGVSQSICTHHKYILKDLRGNYYHTLEEGEHITEAPHIHGDRAIFLLFWDHPETELE